jgi:hypothetical protein
VGFTSYILSLSGDNYIANLTIRGDTSPGYNQFPFEAKYAAGTNIDNVVFFNVKTSNYSDIGGISISSGVTGVSRWKFINCEFNCNWDGIFLSGPGIVATFQGCTFNVGWDGGSGSGNTTHYYDCITCDAGNTQLQVVNCVFNMTDSSTGISGSYMHAVVADAGTNTIQISGSTINQSSGSATPIPIQVSSGNTMLLGAGNTFDMGNAIASLSGGQIYPVAAGAVAPTLLNPKDSTPANRPKGTIGAMVIYSGNFHICTNEATPTWAEITAA